MVKQILTAATTACTLALAAAPLEWSFQAPEKWHFPKGLKVEQIPDGTLVTVTEKPAWGKPPKQFRIQESATRIKADNGKITFHAELITGSGATVGLVLRDAQGESFAFPQLPIKTGVKDFSWDLSKPAGSWGKTKTGKSIIPPVWRVLYFTSIRSPMRRKSSCVIPKPPKPLSRQNSNPFHLLLPLLKNGISAKMSRRKNFLMV